MKTIRKMLSLLLVLLMLLSLVPAYASAEGYVYISVSYDGQYIDGLNGPIAYIPVDLGAVASVDLGSYGLGDYIYDANGDGTAEITALQLVIYAHENLYGGDWSDVTFTGSPGSSYFQGGIFGFDENLNYYLNGEYPLAGEGWGATSDQIVLEAGDYLDIASFSSWDFFQDSNYGFHFFADETEAFTHYYSAEAGTGMLLKLVRSYSGMGSGATVYDESGYEVSYGTSLYNAAGTVTTDDSGCAEIVFPTAGTWYLWADGGYGLEYPDAIVSAPAYAIVTVSAKQETEPEQPAEPEAPSEPEEPDEPQQPDESERTAQDVSGVLDSTMAQLAAAVTTPVFGTDAGEWTVFSLARGNYFTKDNAYFTDYYARIVETVNETATSVNMNGALHKNKSTENSRLIVALSALGKDARSVGNWNLVEAYSANGFDWIKKQGLNGTIWALIALDSNNYATSDESIRQQCVDAILAAQHDDGGWALSANASYASDPDITGMALTALYPYSSQSAVAAACSEALACLSAMQHENGTFESGGSECSESCAWVIVACTTWGINPDTDSRFIKNDNSVVDGLLAHYLADSATFQHIIGAGSNNMATDQSCYALVAYNRFCNGQTALFDYSDVSFEAYTPDTGDGEDEDENGRNQEIKASLGLPENIENTVGTTFNALISFDKWDNEAGYKLIDFMVSVPEALNVTAVNVGERLSGGTVSYNLDENGSLRCVYFDAQENSSLTVSGTEFPAEVFSISFELNKELAEDESLNIAIEGMSVKLSSESEKEDSMIVVDTNPTEPEGDAPGTPGGSGSVGVTTGVSYSAVCIYTGDGIDIIPTDKKAVAVAVTNITEGAKLSYNDGTNKIDFFYSPEISQKTGVSSYIAMVDAAIEMEKFVKKTNYTVGKDDAETISFADSNADAVINAQDALAVVNAWLRKGDAPNDTQMLCMNVNGDSRINTFDALGIVEAFVNQSEYGIVTKAASLSTKSA